MGVVKHMVKTVNSLLSGLVDEFSLCNTCRKSLNRVRFFKTTAILGFSSLSPSFSLSLTLSFSLSFSLSLSIYLSIYLALSQISFSLLCPKSTFSRRLTPSWSVAVTTMTTVPMLMVSRTVTA